MSAQIEFENLEDAERRAGSTGVSAWTGEESDWPEPSPLTRPLAAPAPFPIEALGPVLQNAATAISDIVQCPLAIAACSVLGVASLAAQAQVDVVHPATSRRILQRQ